MAEQRTPDVGHVPRLRVLVAVDSWRGATAELGEAVAEGMREALPGARVSVRRLGDGETVESADAVVIGSAVHLGPWSEDARDLVLRCASDPGFRDPSEVRAWGAGIGAVLAASSCVRLPA